MEKENKIKNFFTRHKKGIYITAGIIGGSVLCFFGIKCYLQQPTLEKFLKESSLNLLKEKRDEIHSEYLKYTKNDEYRNSLWNLLPILDKEISKREWDGKIPSGPAYHREHGYNLYKPD